MKNYQITVKGYFPESRNKGNEIITDLVYSLRTFDFTGTDDELEDYLAKLNRTGAVKIISIHNMAETLIEITKVFDLENNFTGDVIISDCYTHERYSAPLEIAMNLFPDPDRPQLKSHLNGNEFKRFFVNKTALQSFIDLYQCKPL